MDTMAGSPSSVVLYEDDVDDMLQELQESLPFNFRKVKARGNLPAVPEELSLMNVSLHGVPEELSLMNISLDGSTVVSTCSSESLSEQDICAIVMPVKYTFVHFPGATSDARSVQSAGL